METKANPSPNGCLAKALPHEPIFILLGRDLCAPATIRAWAELRTKAGIETEDPQDAEQLLEAFETADAFEKWRKDHDGEWRNPALRPPAVYTHAGKQMFCGGEHVADAVDDTTAGLLIMLLNGGLPGGLNGR